MTGLSIGIDFGTTNTVVALAGADGPAHLVKFPAPDSLGLSGAGRAGGEVFAFRSALSFYAPPDLPNEREV